MSVYSDDPFDSGIPAVKNEEICLDNNISSRINNGGEPPTAAMEQEKRMRREIANSNERRRMQSINNGFQSLRSLLPHHEGEKLSKAAILQQTAEYIYSLEQEKTQLLSQNCQLKRIISQQEGGGGGGGGGGELPPKKRKTEIILSTDSSDEGLGASPEPVGLIVNVAGGGTLNNNMEISELHRQLDRERTLRSVLEDQVRQLENQFALQQPQLYQVDEGVEEEVVALQLVAADSLPPIGHTQTVGVCSPPDSRSTSPEPMMMTVDHQHPQHEHVADVLVAAGKAEPKVEVERLPSSSPNPATAAVVAVAAAAAAEEQQQQQQQQQQASRLYVSNTSRQNLETIVEAIRHLEGDHLFGDEPLALTKNQVRHRAVVAVAAAAAPTTTTPPSATTEFSAALVQQSQQSRPGVIVVKQAS